MAQVVFSGGSGSLAATALVVTPLPVIPPLAGRPAGSGGAPPPAGLASMSAFYLGASLDSVLPKNPDIFRSSKINQEALIFCSANVGPLLFVSDVHEGVKRKVLSGEHSMAVDEVQTQVYWPHMLLHSVIQGACPDYRNKGLNNYSLDGFLTTHVDCTSVARCIAD